MTGRSDLWQLVDAIQMDMRSASTKMVALRAELSALQIPDRLRLVCPACGLTFQGSASLAEHGYHAHEGPTPEHWERAEHLAG